MYFFFVTESCMKSTCPFRHMVDNGGSDNAALHAHSISESLFKKQDGHAMPVPFNPRVQSDTAIACSGGGRQVEICRFNLLGRCALKDTCLLEHCDLPYQWQVQQNNQWTSLKTETNKEIESKFCEPLWGGIHIQNKYVRGLI